MLLPPFLRKLFTLLAVLCLLPGLPELVENLEHLAHDGHLAHSEQHEAHADTEAHQGSLEQEHGCTPLTHHCPCHSSTPAILLKAPPLALPRITAQSARPCGAVLAQISRSNSPPVRPPMA